MIGFFAEAVAGLYEMTRIRFERDFPDAPAPAPCPGLGTDYLLDLVSLLTYDNAREKKAAARGRRR